MGKTYKDQARVRGELDRFNETVNHAHAKAVAELEPEPENTPCWCGEPNPHYEEIHQTCGGSRLLNCICGGDFCVCHNHGEVECFGCPDCEPPDEADDVLQDGGEL